MENLKNLFIDIFKEPQVGWYNQRENLIALDALQRSGGNFSPHLVNVNDPSKVLYMDNIVNPNDFEKVNIPRRSPKTPNGRYYMVAPRNIIPYSPNNKSLANILLRKYMGMAGKAAGKTAVPLAILEGLGLNNPVY